MRRLLWTTVPVALLVGGGILYNYLAPTGWDVSHLLARAELFSAAPANPEQPGRALPPAARKPAIRIASFNLGRFDESRLANARTREVIAQVLGRFDVIALQGIRGAHQGVLVQLLEPLNAAQRDYDYALSPELGLQGSELFQAFVFDRTSIEIDRTTIRPVDDRTGRLHHKPLMGQFRARGPDPGEAFTFCLVNVLIDADYAAEELDVLPAVYRAVREHAHDEDDVILLGTLLTDPPHMTLLEERFGLIGPISGIPTTTRGTQVADRILFPRRATVEFTGRSGVVDLMREFGLTMPEALEVSDHLPVWAEFHVYEGGQPGQVHGDGS